MPTAARKIFMEAATDKELYQAFREHADERALETLVERHWDACWRCALAVVRDGQAAEDLAQQAFVRLIEAARAGKRVEAFAPWLRSIVLNESRAFLRARRRRERREEAKAVRPDAPSSPNGDPLEPILAYTDALPEKLRWPLLLHFGLGLTHAEVGEALGTPTGTASTRIREGLEQLRSRATSDRPATVASLEAAFGAWKLEISKAQAPPAPRAELLVARSATHALVGATTAKKLVLAVAAALLVAAGGSTAWLKLGSGSSSRPSLRDPTALAPSSVPLVAIAAASTSEESAAPRAVVVAPPPHGDSGDESFGPEKHIFRMSAPPPGGAGPSSPVAGSTPASATVVVRDGFSFTGRVVDSQGHGVAGATVELLYRDPAAGERGIQFTKRIKAPSATAATVPPPLPPAEFDQKIRAAMRSSRALRRLVSLASGVTADDGTFKITPVGSIMSQLIVAARVGGATPAQGEKPIAFSPGDRPFDVGDVAVERVPAVTVTVRSNGSPVQGAIVLYEDAGLDPAVGETDKTGEHHYATSAPSVIVTVHAKGFAVERREQSLAGVLDVRLDFDLSLEAVVAGLVLDPNGQPLAGVPVNASDPEAPANFGAPEQPLSVAVTGADGSFSLAGLTQGRHYEVEAKPADKSLLGATLETDAPATNANLTLGRAGSLVLSLVVSDDCSKEQANGWPGVELEEQSADGTWRFTRTDKSVDATTITYARLEPGTYRVHVQPLLFPGVSSDPVTVTGGGPPATVRLELHRGRNVTGRVVDTRGVPIAQARVGRGDKGFFIALVSDESGRFTLSGFTDTASKILIGAPGSPDQEFTVPAGVTDLGDVVYTPPPPKDGAAGGPSGGMLKQGQ
jgi:RNA polymerase sigma-70 factor (ECF subfamily)